ncbi:MAG: hypothetical protein WAW13_01550 [Minisyncoccia bacterium]
MGSSTREQRFVRFVGKFSPSLNYLLYRPYKGAHRGYWYRLPWNKMSTKTYVSL